MNSLKRLGVLYGRLGLSTNADLIKRRSEGVAAVANDLELATVPALLRVAFRLPKADESAAFLQGFDVDPTFDVQGGDKEAALLAAAVLDYEIENETGISPLVALAVVTVAMDGKRMPDNHDELVGSANRMLAYFQGTSTKAPTDRKYTAIPKEVDEQITAIRNTGGNYFSQVSPHVTEAMTQLGKYAEANALAAAKSDNVVLSYVRGLERELRTYWWVSGGWSGTANTPFRKLDITEAAVRAGSELSGMANDGVGLFAAPALLDQILERGRPADAFSDITIRSASSAGDRSWRQKTFDNASGPDLSDLLPLSTALNLAAESDDADDWHPRFERITSLAVTEALSPVTLALQAYRECIVKKAFA